MVSKPIRWGILSTAKIGVTAFIPSARQTEGAELVAVASRSKASAEAFAQTHQIPLALEGYQALLDDDSIDAVYNPLPNTLHAEWTIKAAEAGKHIFCEKPLATTAAEAQRMVDACRAADVLLFEAFVFLHHPQSRRLLELVQGGHIGKLRHIDAGMTFTVKDPANIRLIKDLGGGSIYDGGVYPITFSRFIAASEPLSVQAIMRFDQASGVDVWAALLLEYPDGVTSTLYCGFEGRGGPHGLITGDQGKLVVPSPFHPGEQSSFEIVVSPKERRTEDIRTDMPPFQPAIKFFQECINGQQTPSFMADNAIGSLRIVEAAFESAKTGKRVDL